MMADELIQTIADKKDKFRLKLNDIRIKVATDCFLNKEYNNPVGGCFTYHGLKTGPVAHANIAEDFEKTTEAKKVGHIDVSVKFIAMGSGQIKKHYFYYPGKPSLLKFKEKPGVRVTAQKLYGPIDNPPNAGEDYDIPDGIMTAGYLIKSPKGNRFLPVGVAQEVEK